MAPVLVLGTIIEGRSTLLFMGPWTQSSCPYGFYPLLLTMRLRRFTPFRRPQTFDLSKRVREMARLSAAYLYRTGILTGFPNFGFQDLPSSLGSPNPQLKNVAEESLPFKVSGILVRIRCYLHQDIHNRPLHKTSPPYFQATRSPPYSRAFGTGEVSEAGLAP